MSLEIQTLHDIIKIQKQLMNLMFLFVFSLIPIIFITGDIIYLLYIIIIGSTIFTLTLQESKLIQYIRKNSIED